MAYIPVKLARQVRKDAGRRCGYCRSAEVLTGFPLEYEHIIPEAKGGRTERENLWMACHTCNKVKLDRLEAIDPETKDVMPLFNPRTQVWREHFRWSADGTTIEGLTPSGRATVVALQMNNEFVVEARQYWVLVGWHPPLE